MWLAMLDQMDQMRFRGPLFESVSECIIQTWFKSNGMGRTTGTAPEESEMDVKNICCKRCPQVIMVETDPLEKEKHISCVFSEPM